MTFRITLLTRTISAIAMAMFIFSGGFSVLADFEISPYNANRVSDSEKNWFLLQGTQGQKLRDSFSIKNTKNESIITTFTSKDSQILEDGSFTIIADKEPNKSVGNWLKTDVNNIILDPLQSSQVFFNIDIPTDIKDGEYAAGLSAIETKPSSDAVKTVLRKGLRTYIAVGKDFVLDASVDKLNILDPNDGNFNQVKEAKSYFGKDNMLLTFEVENTGNIFGVLEAKYALKYENGRVFENTFSTQIAPFVGKRTFYIITNQAYQAGNTESILDYNIKPLNIDISKVKTQKVTGVLSDYLKMTQNQLDNFSPANTKAFVKKDEAIATQATQENKLAKKDNAREITIALVFALILISAAGVTYYFWYTRSSKKNNN